MERISPGHVEIVHVFVLKSCLQIIDLLVERYSEEVDRLLIIGASLLTSLLKGHPRLVHS